ncbi:MAG: DNA polymerase Y family protein [Hylemonella sp.]|uniref:Y-family DNA polymerase n=1 Tax=Hylemonella sp. TaxID=2066020 RepID=UPI0022BBF7B6|nr:DNA polymerase Y family protein [Hylemonella sp.]MCZ8252434.1 DNA polymerase Y family protein [Hylemonella sp.]
MLWIALRAPASASSPPHDAADPAPEQLALAWWALQFSPRVCMVEEAVLLEVQDSLRLFGGQRALLQRVRSEATQQGASALAVAPTALAALALLRTLPVKEAAAEDEAHAEPIPAKSCTLAALQRTLDALSIAALSVTHVHAPTLQRLGCRRLGQVRALPRGGVSRRFGAALLEALDRAYGQRPDAFEWIALPETFSARLEFMGRIEVAEGLLFGARRLLVQLGAWLLARQRGVVALTLHWEHDLVRRGDACNGSLHIRTAEATRDMAHLTRLLGEHLARTTLSAPVVAIRLEAPQTEALATQSISLLPEERREGETLQQFIERVSVRLGAERVLRGQLIADHRPQHMQRWLPAATAPVSPRKSKPKLPSHLRLHPPWLLREPLRLAVQGERPIYQGALTLLAGPERLEAGWWSLLSSAEAEGEELALRDYYVAQSPHAGLLWVYRRRSAGEPAWFLQGAYG